MTSSSIGKSIRSFAEKAGKAFDPRDLGEDPRMTKLEKQLAAEAKAFSVQEYAYRVFAEDRDDGRILGYRVRASSATSSPTVPPGRKRRGRVKKEEGEPAALEPMNPSTHYDPAPVVDGLRAWWKNGADKYFLIRDEPEAGALAL